MKNLIHGVWLLFVGFGLVGCQEEFDQGIRGFMSEATVTGDSVNGYHCYLDGGGLVVSYDRRLDGIERGYFAFQYRAEDWISKEDSLYIRDAVAFPYSVYEVIHPVSKEKAEADYLTDSDNCQNPPQLSINGGCRGYFDLSTGIRIVNSKTGEKAPVEMNLIYDTAKQTADTLRLQLYYCPNIPDTWTDPYFEYGSVSCDISDLSALEAWNDSVVVMVEVGDGQTHAVAISKEDFFRSGTVEE